MDINTLDLNLLRVFDAVYRHRSVSRAAEELGLSQPAASQAVTRLRLLLGNALFERVHGGMRPTPRAERLAVVVRAALAALEVGLGEAQSFDPLQAQQVFRLHLSDIGEARFLPSLMSALHAQAPGVRIETLPLPLADIADALDRGTLDAAIGFLPGVHSTQSSVLLHDHYSVMLRSQHPLLKTRRGTKLALAQLRQLEFVAVRSHSETLRILQALELTDRIRLSAAHFLAVPSIVSQTDLAVVMPHELAAGFARDGGYALLDAELPDHRFAVSLHWSRRFAQEPAKVWLRQCIEALFRQAPGAARRNSGSATGPGLS